MSRKSSWRAGLTIPILALSLLACSPKVQVHGNLVDAENLAAIEPGKSDKGRVLALLGSPSSESQFGQETWLYIARHTEQVAFFQETLIDQRVIYIAFDESGLVDSIGKLSKEDGKKIEYVNRETATAGQRISLIQQIFGNLGRFNQNPGQP